MAKTMLMRVRNYPRVHDIRNSWFHGMETGVANTTTIYPLVMQDEGLGAPDSYNAHPEHASFVEETGPNCFPESRINLVISKLKFALTKGALETDGLSTVTCAFMPIFCAFKDDLDAQDELSTLKVSDILELQSESTDRQAYPLYNGVKMVEKFSNSALLDTTVPGLTTTQVLEGVAFQPNKFYDAIQYYTNANKIKSCVGGLKWFTLSRNRPIANIKIKLRSKVKRMNPYTFFGVMTFVPQVDSYEQIPTSGDTTNIPHVAVSSETRYYEWNQDFDFGRV